jgi:hypothetical protein
MGMFHRHPGMVSIKYMTVRVYYAMQPRSTAVLHLIQVIVQPRRYYDAMLAPF